MAKMMFGEAVEAARGRIARQLAAMAAEGGEGWYFRSMSRSKSGWNLTFSREVVEGEKCTIVVALDDTHIVGQAPEPPEPPLFDDAQEVH